MTLSPIVKDVRLEQPLNAAHALIHSSALNVTEVSPEQSEKAQPPIEVTELGMVTEVSPKQSEKAQPPIEVTELGMVSEVIPEQLKKAFSPIEVTELPMVTEVSPEQLAKAHSPIEVTELGNDTDESSVHLKASLSIEVTLYDLPLYSAISGMTIAPVAPLFLATKHESPVS